MPDYIPPRRIPTKRIEPPSAPPSALLPKVELPSDKPRAKTAKEREQEKIRRDVYALIELDRIMGEADASVTSLKAFLKFSWPVIAPGTDFQDNWHIGCIVDHVEELMRRTSFRRLIINIPPRMLKSQIVSVVLPAWRWLTDPAEKFLVASYGRQLALRDSRRCRNLIASKWYQDRWGSRFKLAADQNEKGRFENDKGGFRIIASVEGGVLGEGGSCAIYDDPNDLAKMVSEPDSYPQSVREWYSGTASSRNIDPRSDVRLCIQQRASYGGDLTEYLMELGGWEQLVIPNEYDGRTVIGPLAYPDPRIHPGELLFPDRLGTEETGILKREQKTHYSGQYNQNPTVAGKSGLKREWFNFWVPRGALVKDVTADGTERIRPIRLSLTDGSFVEKTPIELPDAFEQTVHSLDCAFKGNDANDFVADHVWSRIGAHTFLRHREHGHWNFPETLSVVRRVSNLFPSPEKLVEDKANGPAVVQTLRNEIPGLIEVNPEGGKWSRVAAISGYVEAGNVHLPSPDLFPWVWDLLAEFSAGQSAKHDDDTDAMSQALKRLYDAQAQSGLPEFRVQPLTGEPSTACHIAAFTVPADWRRFIALVPNRAALWLAESPAGTLRVYRELNLDKLDATTVGQNIVALSLSDLNAPGITPIRPSVNAFSRSYDIFMPKSAFAVIDSVGSWAELMEAALLAWEKPDGEWEERKFARETVKSARFRAELVEEETETALDRLRELLAFQPPEWTTRKYDRKLALALAEKDLNEYHDYMAQVEGKVRGEWPKLKLSPACPQLISQIGTVRRDKLNELPAFVEALLLGVSAPQKTARHELTTRPYVVSASKSPRNQGLLSRKFAMR